MAPDQSTPTTVGPNAWLVDEMYEQYLADPTSVNESWQDFFADYRPGGGQAPLPAPGTTEVAPPAPTAAAAPAPSAPPAAPPTAAAPASTDTKPAKVQLGEPIRGAGARIVSNMEASLTVPTATSFREVPAKLLEVNRSVINGYLGRTGRGKISFTHLIGFAVVRAIADTTPVMNSHFEESDDGKPFVIRHEHIGLGIAVDQEKADGSRSLLVPCVKDADTLDFRGFWMAYE